ncbi:MAG: DHHA2 domain-containing protein [Patescibacteria group bacterium]|jgi:inorganic pyrophosphatase/exopolyphosphatase
MEFDKFIIVDASDIKGMPEVIRAKDVVEVIDHRETHKAKEVFPNAKIQIELVGAAATLIFEKMRDVKFPINSNNIFLLFGAIFSNTLNFKSDIAGERDLGAVKSLKDNYGVIIPSNLIDDMFKYKTEYIANNLEEVINGDFKTFDGGLGVAQLEGFDLQNLIGDKIENIKEILKKIKEKFNLEYIFLTAADIKNEYNIFVVIDKKTNSLLSKSIGLSFNDKGVAKNNKLFLRKQLLPLLINQL